MGRGLAIDIALDWQIRDKIYLSESEGFVKTLPPFRKGREQQREELRACKDIINGLKKRMPPKNDAMVLHL